VQAATVEEEEPPTVQSAPIEEEEPPAVQTAPVKDQEDLPSVQMAPLEGPSQPVVQSAPDPSRPAPSPPAAPPPPASHEPARVQRQVEAGLEEDPVASLPVSATSLPAGEGPPAREEDVVAGSVQRATQAVDRQVEEEPPALQAAPLVDEPSTPTSTPSSTTPDANVQRTAAAEEEELQRQPSPVVEEIEEERPAPLQRQVDRPVSGQAPSISRSVQGVSDQGAAGTPLEETLLSRAATRSAMPLVTPSLVGPRRRPTVQRLPDVEEEEESPQVQTSPAAPVTPRTTPAEGASLPVRSTLRRASTARSSSPSPPSLTKTPGGTLFREGVSPVRSVERQASLPLVQRKPQPAEQTSGEPDQATTPADNVTLPTVQAAFSPPEQGEGGKDLSSFDLDVLARQVYPRIKRLLAVERERSTRR
jgi:hypothetical protein